MIRILLGIPSQRLVVFEDRRFGTPYRFHLQQVIKYECGLVENDLYLYVR